MLVSCTEEGEYSVQHFHDLARLSGLSVEQTVSGILGGVTGRVASQKRGSWACCQLSRTMGSGVYDRAGCRSRPLKYTFWLFCANRLEKQQPMSCH